MPRCNYCDSEELLFQSKKIGIVRQENCLVGFPLEHHNDLTEVMKKRLLNNLKLEFKKLYGIGKFRAEIVRGGSHHTRIIAHPHCNNLKNIEGGDI